MVSAVEHFCVGYYDSITKKKARAHVNERNVVNYIMCPAVTKKLRHVSGDKSMVNPYQKPQRLINRLIELFSNPDDWVLDLFSGTGIIYIYLISSLRRYFLYIFICVHATIRYYDSLCIEDV